MSGSLLDMLRQRTTSAMQDEALRRASEFGAGMLASGSPNFFTMLAGGARAQAEGDRSRTDELRRLADIERQQRALENQEAARREEESYRRDRLRLDERRIAQGDRPQYQVVGQDAQGNAIVVNMLNPTQRQTLEGVTPMQVANLNARTEAQNQQTLARLVEAAVNREATNRSNMNRPFSDADRAAVRRQAEVEGRRILGLPPLPETDAAGGGGQPRPDRTLTYPRTP